jgi:hypothetical protein
MRLRLPVVSSVLLALAAAGCARSPGIFSEENAHAHVSMLAGTIGSRPVGTEPNARARAYVVDQLKLYGYDVRVQEIDARRPELGRTARVSNIIAVLGGERSEAIGLVSHYDSAPESPGAADDGLGVAVSLEAARVLAARTDRKWSILVLVTDGEEAGLMGAAGLVTDREVMSRLKVYINTEAIGSRGVAMLFQAGPANGWVTRPWARRAPHPRGASFAVEVYKHLPNDTDFTILSRQDIPGLNFATIGDSYAYHTPRDTADRLSRAALRLTGENVVATALGFDGVDITVRTGRGAVFFDLGGVTALSYSGLVGWLLAAAAMILGAMAWLRITGAALRIGGGWRWTFTAFWSALGAALSGAAMIGAVWALRAAREVYHPWYARPGRLFLLLVAVGATVAWTLSRAGAWIPARLHGLRHPVVTWSLALPLWLVMSGTVLWLAPGAAFLWTVPLLAASALLMLVPLPRSQDIRMPEPPAPALDPASHYIRLVSVVVLAVTGALWLHNVADLLRFVVAIFGRLPVVTPIYVYPAVMLVAAVMVVPPFVAAIAAPRPLLRPSLLSAICLLAIAVTAGLAYAAPAYTYEQPLRRQVRALQEAGGQIATWEVGSVEPGLDLAAGAPAGWTRQAGAMSASIPWGRLPHPFVFRASGPELGPPPLEIAGFTVTPMQAGTEVTLTVVPKRPGLAISFVVPGGIAPARSSLPGALRLGLWTAAFIAPPSEGIAWRASFAGVDSARLREIRIAVTDSGFPGGTGPQRLPAWLPQERTVWTAAATWVVPAGSAAPLEPVPALR